MLSTNLLMAMAGLQTATTGSSYRYWRIFITALNVAGTTVGLDEIELRGTVGGADLTTPGTPTLASSFLHWEANSYPPSSTVANSAPIWYSEYGELPPHWVRYDLGAAQVVAQVAIMPAGPDENTPRDFIIQGSADGTTFTNVKSFAGVAAWVGWKTFNLT